MAKRWWGSVGIVLAAAVGAAGWWTISEQTAGEQDHIITTEVGQQREIRLADGPRIVLNTETTLATRESSEQVEIELRSGEALFDTSVKPEKRLRVAAGAAVVDASRGKFSIRRLSTLECVVRVFSGDVQVAPGPSLLHVKLDAGRSALFGRDKMIVDRFSAQGRTPAVVDPREAAFRRRFAGGRRIRVQQVQPRADRDRR